MAPAPARGKNTRPAQSLTLLLWQDALLSWGIPVLLGGAIAVVVVLSSLEQIPQSTGIVVLGWLLLLLRLRRRLLRPRLKRLRHGHADESDRERDAREHWGSGPIMRPKAAATPQPGHPSGVLASTPLSHWLTRR